MHFFLSSAKFAVILVLGLVLVFSGCTTNSKTGKATKSITTSQKAKSKPKARTKIVLPSHVTRTGEVILLRGLANIFSRGMDTIGDRLKAKGVNARVYNHGAWQDLAADLIKRNKTKQVSYPVIIMGHSLGGNASVQMATYLGKRGVPVSFVVAFDPTITTVAGARVNRVINYYLPNGKNRVRRGAGFKGKLSNINVSNIPNIKHTTVEKTRKLQNRSISTVMKLVKKRRKRGKRS